jgi:hypothetical protein
MKMVITKNNATWMVNGKKLNECFGFERDFFISFIRFMTHEKSLEEYEPTKKTLNLKRHNYKFTNKINV